MSSNDEFDEVQEHGRSFVSVRRTEMARTLPQPYLLAKEAFDADLSQRAFLQECRYFLRTYVMTSAFVSLWEAKDAEVGKESFDKLKSMVTEWSEFLNEHQEVRNLQTKALLEQLISSLAKRNDKPAQDIESIWDADESEFAHKLAQLVNEVAPDMDLKPDDLIAGNKDFVHQSAIAEDISLSEGWKAPMFNVNMETCDKCLETLASYPEWEYWHGLLSGFRSGNHPNLELAEQVSQLPEDVWEGGIGVVSDAIASLSAELLIEETDLVEELYFDAATEKIARKTPPSANGKALELTIASIADDLEEALRGNYLSEETYVVRVLKKTIAIHAKNPERVEMDLVKVSKNLRTQIDKGDLPDAPEIEGLHDACVTGALDIRAHHPDIAEARRKRSLQAIREASSEERALLKESYETLREVAEAELAQDLIDDLDEIVDGRSVAPDGDVSQTTEAIARSGSRLAKMWIIAKQVGSGMTTAAKSVGVFAKAAQELKRLWPLLMGLLGL